MIFINHMHQVITVKVFISQYAEDIVEHGSCRFNIRMLNNTTWLKAGKDELIHKLFQWYTILQTDTYRNSERIGKTAHGSAFFGHVYKYFTEGTIAIFTCPEKQRLATYFSFECVAATFGRKLFPFYNTAQFPFQPGIRTGLYSFVHLIQQLIDGHQAHIHDLGSLLCGLLRGCRSI